MFAGIEVDTATDGSTFTYCRFRCKRKWRPDAWVDGFDIDGASAGTYATVAYSY